MRVSSSFGLAMNRFLVLVLSKTVLVLEKPQLTESIFDLKRLVVDSIDPANRDVIAEID